MLRKLAENRGKKVDAFTIEILTKMFEQDLMVFDVHFVQKRALEILQYIYKQIKFHNMEILVMRKEFLKKCIDEAMKALSKAPPLERDKKDEVTDERNQRCEPIAQKIIHDLLLKELLLGDEDYFVGACEEQSEQMFQVLVMGYFNALFESLEFSMSESLLNANKNLWGKTKDRISFRNVDEVLKRPLQENK